MKQKVFKCFILFLSSLIGLTIVLISELKNNGNSETNDKYMNKNLIPNLVHYVIFNKNEINFETYLSILSVLKFQKPDFILIHSNVINISGFYWEKIKKYEVNTKSFINVSYLVEPTHVFGQRLSSVYHASDVARILVLQQWGGIYIDTDVVVLKNLNYFRQFEMVVGWPENEFMGTQVKYIFK